MQCIGNTVVGPLFIAGNLTGEVYLNMLEEAFNTLNEITENDQNLIIYILQFQQDWTPPRYITRVIEFLDARYFGRRIERTHSIKYPVNSLHLAALDFT